MHIAKYCAMETNTTTVFDLNDLADARARALAELEEQCTTFASTAPEPIERAALAELAEEMRNLRHRWQVKGLIKLEGAGREAARAA
jgi:hypothetical protein